MRWLLICSLLLIMISGCRSLEKTRSTIDDNPYYPVASLLDNYDQVPSSSYSLLLLTRNGDHNKNIKACMIVLDMFNGLNFIDSIAKKRMNLYIPIITWLKVDHELKEVYSGVGSFRLMGDEEMKRFKSLCEVIIHLYDYRRAQKFLVHPEINDSLSQHERQGPVLVAVPPDNAANDHGFIVLSMANYSDDDMGRAVDVWTVHVARNPEDWHKGWWLARFRESLRNILKQTSQINLALISSKSTEAIGKGSNAPDQRPKR